jgi:hypothetical protein
MEPPFDVEEKSDCTGIDAPDRKSIDAVFVRLSRANTRVRTSTRRTDTHDAALAFEVHAVVHD